MSSPVSRASILAAAVFAGACGPDAGTVEPGLWEIVASTAVPDRSEPLQSVTRICFTDEDFALARILQAQDDCTLSEREGPQGPGHVLFDLSCSEARSRGDFTVSRQAFSGTTTATVASRDLEQDWSGRHVRPDCGDGDS